MKEIYDMHLVYVSLLLRDQKAGLVSEPTNSYLHCDKAKPGSFMLSFLLSTAVTVGLWFDLEAL
jgi:hypothetical protein